MGCSGWFNGCADGSDLSSAAIVVDLGIEGPSGEPLIYLGRSVDDNDNVDGEIVEVAQETLQGYNGDNLFQPSYLTPEGVEDFGKNVMVSGLQTVEILGISDDVVFQDGLLAALEEASEIA